MHDEIQSLLRHEDYLRRRAVARVGNAADAEDLMQDLWLALLSAPPENLRSEKAFLSGMLRHLSVSGFRKDRARRRREEKSARPEALPSAADVAEQRALRQSLLSELLSLDEPYRRSLLLRHVSDMGAQEIGDYLGVPAATIRSHLHRGVAILRGKMGLEDEGRRRRAMALILPFLSYPSRRHWTLPVVSAALIIAVSTAIYRFNREDHQSSPLGQETASNLRVDLQSARRSTALVVEPLAPAPATKHALETPALTGRIQLATTDDRPSQARLRIAATPMLTGPEANFLGLMAEPAAGLSNDLLDFQTTKAGYYRIPVAEAGQYRLHLLLDGQAGTTILNQATPEAVDHEIILLGDLNWQAAREGLSFVGTGPDGGAIDFGPEMIRAGPVLPGSPVQVLDRAKGLLWQTEIREESARVAPPEAEHLSVVQVMETGGGVLVDAKVTLKCWGRDHREWQLELQTDAEGLLRLPRLKPLEERLEASLTISHPRVGRFLVPGHEAVLPPLDLGPLTFKIDAISRSEYRLLGSDQTPIADALGVRIQDEVLIGWSRSSSAGTLQMNPMGLAEPRYFIPMDGPVGPQLWFTFPGQQEQLLLWHEDRGFLAMSSPKSSTIIWPEGHRPSVQVLDAATQEPLAAVELRVVLAKGMASMRLTPRLPILTTATGQATLPAVSGGEFAVLVAKPGYQEQKVSLAELATGPIQLAKLSNPQVRQTVKLLDECGRPLSDVRCGLADLDSSAELRYTTDQFGRVVFDAVNPEKDYRFRALAAGRELSLKEVTELRPSLEERVFQCVPIAPQMIDFGRPEAARAVAATLILEVADGRLRALFGNELNPTILATQEAQRVTIYRPGFQTEVVDWRPELGAIRCPRHPGFELSARLADFELGDHLRLLPIDLAQSPEHSAPLATRLGDFEVEVAPDGPSFRSPALSPGRWTIQHWRGDSILLEKSVRIFDHLDLGQLSAD